MVIDLKSVKSSSLKRKRINYLVDWSIAIVRIERKLKLFKSFYWSFKLHLTVLNLGYSGSARGLSVVLDDRTKVYYKEGKCPFLVFFGPHLFFSLNNISQLTVFCQLPVSPKSLLLVYKNPGGFGYGQKKRSVLVLGGCRERE